MEETRATFPAAVIARLLNITERRVQQLAKEGIIPKASRGRYPLAACVQGYCKFLQERVSQASSGDALELNAERARLAKEQADKTALENAVSRRELIYRTHMVEVMGGMLTSFRARLLASPSKMAPRANPGNPSLARDIIERELTDILAEFSDLESGPEPGERKSNGNGAVVDPAPTAKVNGKPVGRRKSKAKSGK